MLFEKLPIEGAYKIDLEKRGDNRGFFARYFDIKEYEEHGLNGNIVNINTSLTGAKNTFRGLHYQLHPKAEVRIVRCLRGALYDVMVDLRPHSPTFKQSFGIELTPENRTMVYVPQGCAHGFLTLEDDTEMLYLVTEFYAPEHERGIRWDDPNFDVKLPVAPEHLSEKDINLPDFTEEHNLPGLDQIAL